MTGHSIAANCGKVQSAQLPGSSKTNDHRNAPDIDPIWNGGFEVGQPRAESQRRVRSSTGHPFATPINPASAEMLMRASIHCMAQ
jgi:hypothetical protein